MLCVKRGDPSMNFRPEFIFIDRILNLILVGLVKIKPDNLFSLMQFSKNQNTLLYILSY